MTISVERTSPTSLLVTRRFTAPPERVWAAHMRPDLLKKWCYGPDGWTMPLCEVDATPGGRFRYGWEGPDGASFSLSGEYRVVEPPVGDTQGRTIHVERMHLGPDGPDPTPDNLVETIFARDGAGTLLTMTMTVDDAATMDAMVATGMTDGMETGYSRLDAVA